MPQHRQLSAQPRTIQGKEVSKLRRAGNVPGVVFGPAIEAPRKVMVDQRAFDEAFRAVGSTSLVDLTVDGAEHSVFIRTVQQHPIKHTPLHVEFYAPNLNQLLTASVAVSLVGELPSGVVGVLEHGRLTVDVRAQPENLPSQFEVDLARLDAPDAAVQVGDLAVPDNVEILTPAEELVVKLTVPAVPQVEPGIQEVLDEATGDLPAAVNEGAEPVEEA
jgi:large subunit ribosomal protein L25